MFRTLRPFKFPRYGTAACSMYFTRPPSNNGGLHQRSYYNVTPTRATEKLQPKVSQVITMHQSIQTPRRAQAHIIPHPEKGGSCEDAYFICDNGTTFGIADGVGVWSELGINSGLYSTTLLQNVKEYLEQHEGCTLYKALHYAHRK